MNLYTESKDPFSAKETEEQIRLMLVQRDLEATLPPPTTATTTTTNTNNNNNDTASDNSFVGMSLSDTLYKLIVLGHHKVNDNDNSIDDDNAMTTIAMIATITTVTLQIIVPMRTPIMTTMRTALTMT